MNDRVYETRPGRRKKPAPNDAPAVVEPSPVVPGVTIDTDFEEVETEQPELVNQVPEEKPEHHAHKKAKAHRHAN